MSWGSSNRKKRFNRGWAKIRMKVLERDGHMCQWPMTDENGFYAGVCGAYANEVDHRNQNMVRDDDRLSQLWALCHYHHARKTGVESVKGKYRAKTRREEARFFDHPAFR